MCPVWFIFLVKVFQNKSKFIKKEEKVDIFLVKVFKIKEDKIYKEGGISDTFSVKVSKIREVKSYKRRRRKVICFSKGF